MKKMDISAIHKDPTPYDGRTVRLCGWVKTLRDSKTVGFLQLNDGSHFKDVQVVFTPESLENFEEVVKLGVGTSVRVQGQVKLTPEAKQPFEIQATHVEIEGVSPSDYPLQKKHHTLEYLRTIAHLRPRTNTFGAVYRMRSEVSFAIHNFFHENGFAYVHTPVITGSDCEGAGEMFSVTSLDLTNVPKKEDGTVDFSKDFFGKNTSLTVSGQLEGECMAMALGKVYTFGPTFRAENSHTTRHASEFWMVEPEMAFADLVENMDIAERMIKAVISHVLDRCPHELRFFNTNYDRGLLERLENIVNSDFGILTYTNAIEILQKSGQEFEFPVSWGIDLQTEHERYLTDIVFKKPVFVTNYPKAIKAFYMRENEDGRTVAAMDLLVPGIGEIIGGSQREERLDKLQGRMAEVGLSQDEYWWYLDLRRYGTTVHSGFGLGFERLIMYLTGIQNIRDVLLFPRTPGSAEF